MNRKNTNRLYCILLSLCIAITTCSLNSCSLFSSSNKDSNEEESSCSTCTNTLYCSPYLIFQASMSTKPSDFYLVAFDTHTGQITKINKGYHRRFFIRHKKLYFRQRDSFYTCNIGSFDSWEEIDKPTFFEKLASEEGHLEYVEDCKEMPEEFRTIDTYFINQVVRGHITNTGFEDTIFLTGDEKKSSVGIIRDKEGVFVPTIASYLPFQDHEPYPFWQALITNIDEDPLEEIVMIGHFHNHNHNPTVVYIWEYDEVRNKLVSHIVDSYTRVSNPELVAQDNGVFLRYTFKDKLSTYKLTQNSSTHSYSMEPTHEEVIPVLLDHVIEPYFPRFSFLENFENSNALTFSSIPSTTTFPFVTLPDTLSINPSSSSIKEKAYVSKYNDYLTQFVHLLEKGTDPFDQEIPSEEKEEEPDKSPAVMITKELDSTDSHFKWDSKGFIHHIDVFFPIVLDNEDYIFIHAVDNFPKRYTFLFDSNWNLLEYTSYEGVDHNISVIYSLEKPDYFWISNWRYFGPYMLDFCHIQNGKLKHSGNSCTPSFYRKNGKVYFEYSHAYIFIETKNSDSYMQASEFVDPFTREVNYEDFQDEMLSQYDLLYMYYFCFRYKYASFDNEEYLDRRSCLKPEYCHTIAENQKKINTWFYPGKVLEEYEETLHEQGWE